MGEGRKIVREQAWGWEHEERAEQGCPYRVAAVGHCGGGGRDPGVGGATCNTHGIPGAGRCQQVQLSVFGG